MCTHIDAELINANLFCLCFFFRISFPNCKDCHRARRCAAVTGIQREYCEENISLQYFTAFISFSVTMYDSCLHGKTYSFIQFHSRLSDCWIYLEISFISSMSYCAFVVLLPVFAFLGRQNHSFNVLLPWGSRTEATNQNHLSYKGRV